MLELRITLEEGLESIPGRLDPEISKGLEAHKRGEKYNAELMLKFSILMNDEITAEFEKVSKLHSDLL